MYASLQVCIYMYIHICMFHNLVCIRMPIYVCMFACVLFTYICMYIVYIQNVSTGAMVVVLVLVSTPNTKRAPFARRRVASSQPSAVSLALGFAFCFCLWRARTYATHNCLLSVCACMYRVIHAHALTNIHILKFVCMYLPTVATGCNNSLLLNLFYLKERIQTLICLLIYKVILVYLIWQNTYKFMH